MLKFWTQNPEVRAPIAESEREGKNALKRCISAGFQRNSLLYNVVKYQVGCTRDDQTVKAHISVAWYGHLGYVQSWRHLDNRVSIPCGEVG
jgi:hypothetical protein